MPEYKTIIHEKLRASDQMDSFISVETGESYGKVRQPLPGD